MKKSRTRRRRRRGGLAPRSEPVADQPAAGQRRPHSMLPLLYNQAKNSPKSAQSEKPSLVLEQEVCYKAAQASPRSENLFQSEHSLVPNSTGTTQSSQPRHYSVESSIVQDHYRTKCLEKLSKLYINLIRGLKSYNFAQRTS